MACIAHFCALAPDAASMELGAIEIAANLLKWTADGSRGSSYADVIHPYQHHLELHRTISSDEWELLKLAVEPWLIQ